MQLTRLVENDERMSSYFLTYRRVTVANINPYVGMGPTLLGEYAYPVEVKKFADDFWQIGFCPTAPKEQV